MRHLSDLSDLAFLPGTLAAASAAAERSSNASLPDHSTLLHDSPATLLETVNAKPSNAHLEPQNALGAVSADAGATGRSCNAP